MELSIRLQYLLEMCEFSFQKFVAGHLSSILLSYWLKLATQQVLRLCHLSGEKNPIWQFHGDFDFQLNSICWCGETQISLCCCHTFSSCNNNEYSTVKYILTHFQGCSKIIQSYLKTYKQTDKYLIVSVVVHDQYSTSVVSLSSNDH